MLKDSDQYFYEQHEPVKSCLVALRNFVLHFDESITEVWMYKMPFYYYKGKRFCYLWTDKKRNQPYLGIVDGNKIVHPKLIAEKRSRMKILLVDAEKDIPLNLISDILMMAVKVVEDAKQ
jgi:hypothetical protein